MRALQGDERVNDHLSGAEAAEHLFHLYKDEVYRHVRQESKRMSDAGITTFRSSGRRIGPMIGGVAAATIAVVIGATAFQLQTGHATGQHKQAPVPVPVPVNIASSEPLSQDNKPPSGEDNGAFIPPKDMSQIFDVSSADGKLEIEGYSKSPVQFASEMYVVLHGKVISHVTQENADIDQPLIIENGSVYGVLVPTVTMPNNTAYTNVKVYQVSNQSQWKVLEQSVRSFGFSAKYYKIGQSKILVQATIGAGDSTWCEVTDTSVKLTTVTNPVPQSSTHTKVVHIHVTKSLKNGHTMYTFSSDPSTIHIRIGDTLVVTSDDSGIPIGVLPSHQQDPSGFSTAVPSPYVNSVSFRMEQADQNAWLMVWPGIYDSSTVIQGTEDIPLVVDK
jgi:hypothetical protein